ncbi:MAG: UDP-3-O-(3-hydroxymyristoyl)glucosamine N-acyltransferase [Dissulfurispiraceae bacterium]|jgi:UDP-3-O-[3-hydroxymyristoyl] glucosamine N-acyltransferase
MKLQELADLLDGEIKGDGAVEITGVAGISDAREKDITFLSGPKLLKEAIKSGASAVLVKDFVPELQKPQVKTGNPHYAFARLLSHFYIRPARHTGISRNAFVSGEAEIARDVTIYDSAYISGKVKIGPGAIIFPGVFIGEACSIGEECTIYPNVTIRENTVIGNRVIVHPNAVIGSDGFGFVFENGKHNKIPQVGNVRIEDDVEIGAGVTIDRATTGTTVIGKGTKIDNLVQIGHNVRVGSNVILVAQVGIGGSSQIGDGVILGGQIGVADHAVIEAGTMVAAQSGVMGEVKRGVYAGTPIIAHRDWLKATALFARLPELKKRIEELEKKLSQLQETQQHGNAENNEDGTGESGNRGIGE